MKASGILTGTDWLFLKDRLRLLSLFYLLSTLQIILLGPNLGSHGQLAGLCWVGSFHSFVQVPAYSAASPACRLTPSKTSSLPRLSSRHTRLHWPRVTFFFLCCLGYEQKMKPTEASSRPGLPRVKPRASAHSALNILCMESSLG